MIVGYMFVGMVMFVLGLALGVRHEKRKGGKE